MTLHPEASPSQPSSETFLVSGRVNCDYCGPVSGRRRAPAFGRLVMGAAARQPPFRRQIPTLSSIQPLNGIVLEKSILPPLGDSHVPHQGGEQSFGFSKMLSGGHAWRPFNISYSERYKPSVTHTAFFPSTLVLRGLSAFPVQNCKYSRAKGNDPACNLLTLKGDLKSQSYPDPVMGASRSFLHRISELSCLEGETVRQEKLKKWRMSRKAASS
ncbi:putative uncharacterized protein C8orf89 homolog isoform X2 [Festucalex cinctus]